jgi:hypothetical protein
VRTGCALCHVDDHLPEYTHVLGDGSAKIAFGAEIVYVDDNAGMSIRDVRRAMRVVEQNRALFPAAWKEIHG